MRADDLPLVKALSDATYPLHHEGPDIFAERLNLYAPGCFVRKDASGFLAGYAITHPFKQDLAPALNSLLRQLPELCDTYYIHDIALRADQRGTGLAGEIVTRIKEHAKASGFARINLIAVNNSRDFWRRQNFVVREVASLHDKLLSYERAAVYMEHAIEA